MESEIQAVMDCLSRAVRDVSRQIWEDMCWIKVALTTRGETLSYRQTRNFRLVVKENDMPCWLDDDDNLPVVLDAILNRGARYSSVGFFVTSDKVDQILVCGRMYDVLRIPGKSSHRWMDLILLHEVVAEARAEISLVRNTLSAIRPVQRTAGGGGPLNPQRRIRMSPALLLRLFLRVVPVSR